MKVCVICPHFPVMSYPCGAADFALGLSRTLSETHEVTVLTANPKTISDPSLRIHMIPGPWGVRSLFRIAAWMRSQNLDVIDVQYESYMYGQMGWILLLPLLLPSRVRKILTLHSESLPKSGGRLWRLAQIKLFQHVVFYSDQFLQNTLRRFPNDGKKFSLSPFPANIARYPDTTLNVKIRRHFKGLESDGLFLSYFGHLSEGRGIEYLIEAVHQARDLSPQLIFIGQFDPSRNAYHRDLVSLIHSKNLQSLITFTGRLEEKEVSQIISMSDAGVLPFAEGASFKNGSLAAYVSHQVPVLTTKSELTEAVLRNSEGIVFFDLSDVATLGTLLKKLSASPTDLQRLRSGLRGLDELYSWTKYKEKRESIYQNEGA